MNDRYKNTLMEDRGSGGRGKTGMVGTNSNPAPYSSNNAMTIPTYNPNISALQAQLAKMMQGFGDQRNALQSQYNTGLASTETAYQNLLVKLAEQAQDTRKDFGAARATIAEDAFTRGRNLANNLASRNLSASGIMQLGDVQNRMETGRQVSSVANNYFDTQENIADARVEGTQTYESAKRQLADQLAANMANLLSQEASAQMSGLSMIEQLRQAGVSSQQAAAAANQEQQSLRNSLDYDVAVIASDTSTNYNTKMAMIQAQYANAGVDYNPSQIQNKLNYEAKNQYNALVNVNGYENSDAKNFRLQMIALGYPSSLFTETKTTTNYLNRPTTPQGWTAPTQAGKVYGELRQSGGRNFMWDGTRWLPKA